MQNNTFAYNVSVNNGVLVVMHTGNTIFTTEINNLAFYNNTVYDNYSELDPLQFKSIWENFQIITFSGDASTVQLDTLKLKNNIFYTIDMGYFSSNRIYTHTNNLYYLINTVYGPPDPLPEDNEIFETDPLFIDISKRNFHLQPTSQAIDAGINLGYNIDYDNYQIPYGSSPDIGVFEFGSNTSPPNNNGYKDLHRFWSENYKAHFYTISEGEKQNTENNPNWSYEGIAYKVVGLDTDKTCLDNNSLKVYRYWSDNYQRHFYAINETENQNTMENPNWTFEGEMFCAFTGKIEDTNAVYRFWNELYQGHFYTISETEKNDIQNNNPDWTYEGVAYYAIP